MDSICTFAVFYQQIVLALYHSPHIRRHIRCSGTQPTQLTIMARRHIVLAVYHPPSRRWGALGLSRRDELMWKELGYETLGELVRKQRCAVLCHAFCFPGQKSDDALLHPSQASRLSSQQPVASLLPARVLVDHSLRTPVTPARLIHAAL